MLTEMRRGLVIVACVAAAGCGPVKAGVVTSTGSSSAHLTDCSTVSTAFLSGRDMPMAATPGATVSSSDLGLFGTGDRDYSGFVGRTEKVYEWTGLSSRPARDLIQASWSALNYPGQAPAGFLPVSGALFSTFPAQIFRVAEEVDNFGSTDSAVRWMSTQETGNAPNNDPKTRNGLESNLVIPPMGDYSFAYQLIKGSPGDVLTDVMVRDGGSVVAVSVEGGPRTSGAQVAVALETALLKRYVETCPGL